VEDRRKRMRYNVGRVELRQTILAIKEEEQRRQEVRRMERKMRVGTKVRSCFWISIIIGQNETLLLRKNYKVAAPAQRGPALLPKVFGCPQKRGSALEAFPPAVMTKPTTNPSP